MTNKTFEANGGIKSIIHTPCNCSLLDTNINILIGAVVHFIISFDLISTFYLDYYCGRVAYF